MKVIAVLGLAVTLAGCTSAAQQDARKYQADIASVCGVAMTLASLAGPIAPWIIGACSTEEAVAKLALDPTSLEWLNGLIRKARG